MPFFKWAVSSSVTLWCHNHTVITQTLAELKWKHGGRGQLRPARADQSKQTWLFGRGFRTKHFLVDTQKKRTWNFFSILAAAGDSESCSRTRQQAGLLSLVTMFSKASKFCLPTGPGPLCHCTMFCHSCNLKSVKPEQTPFHTLAFLTF